MRCSAYATASGLIEYEAITAFFPGRGYQALGWGRRMITGPPGPSRARWPPGLAPTARSGRGSLDVTGPGRALLKRGNPGPRHQPGSPYPWVTYGLVAANVIVLLLTPASQASVTGSSSQAQLCSQQAFYDHYAAIRAS